MANIDGKGQGFAINCTGCTDCAGCTRCVDCTGCTGCARCVDCTGCTRCVDCTGCTDCSGCTGCTDCSGLINGIGMKDIRYPARYIEQGLRAISTITTDPITTDPLAKALQSILPSLPPAFGTHQELADALVMRLAGILVMVDKTQYDRMVTE